jgi:hypothetical protein
VPLVLVQDPAHQAGGVIGGQVRRPAAGLVRVPVEVVPAQDQALAVLVKRLHEAGLHRREATAQRPVNADPDVARPLREPVRAPRVAPRLAVHAGEEVPRDARGLLAAVSSRPPLVVSRSNWVGIRYRMARAFRARRRSRCTRPSHHNQRKHGTQQTCRAPRVANGVRCIASRWHMKKTACRPLPMAPGRGPSRAHTAPVRARPLPVPAIPPAPGIRPGCGRPRPSLPGASLSGALPQSLWGP